jgi:hypothetical protein
MKFALPLMPFVTECIAGTKQPGWYVISVFYSRRSSLGICGSVASIICEENTLRATAQLFIPREQIYREMVFVISI